MNPTISPLGDSAVYIEFSEALNLTANAKAQALARYLQTQVLPWLRDIVPTLGGVALHFDLEHADLAQTPLDAARALLSLAQKNGVLAESATSTLAAQSRVVEVPICYAPEYGLDLDEMATRLNLSASAIVQAHTQAQYRVLMMGFVPGCPYMGGLDPSINLPRKTTPRARVPAGSVGIANHQAVIYPFETPGGWNIVGRTPLRLFDAQRDPACVFAPFDVVKFVPISVDEFHQQAQSLASQRSAE